MAVTLTAAQTADAGAPQVGVTVAGLSTTTGCTVVVTVSWDGGATWNTVRGGIVNGALGSTFIRDYVPPLNVSAIYQAVVTGGSTATVTGTVTATSSYAWLQDPLAPRSAVPLSIMLDPAGLFLVTTTFGSFLRAQAADRVTVMGSDLPAISLGVRQAPSGVPLNIQGFMATQGALVASLRVLFATAGQLVLRGLPASVPFDPVVHVSVGDVDEQPTVDGILGVRNTWNLVVSQVRPVSMRVVIPWWTYDQVYALIQTQVSAGATYAAVITAMPAGKTYTQWVANPGVV